MSETRTAIFSERVAAGRLSYFLDVRESSTGKVYLSLAQSRRSAGDVWEQERILVFEDHLPAFRKALNTALRIISRETGARRRADLEELRKTHPKAFARWAQEEEGRLTRSFGSGRTPEELAVELGRTPRAVELHLQKLGLIPAPGPEPGEAP